MEQGGRKLPLGQAAEEVARQVREVLQEQAHRALVVVDLGPMAPERGQLALEDLRTGQGLPGGCAEAKEHRNEQGRGRGQAEHEREEGHHH